MKASDLMLDHTIKACDDESAVGWTVAGTERRYENPEVGPGFFSKGTVILLTLERTVRANQKGREGLPVHVEAETRTACLRADSNVEVE